MLILKLVPAEAPMLTPEEAGELEEGKEDTEVEGADEDDADTDDDDTTTGADDDFSETCTGWCCWICLSLSDEATGAAGNATWRSNLTILALRCPWDPSWTRDDAECEGLPSEDSYTLKKKIGICLISLN